MNRLDDGFDEPTEVSTVQMVFPANIMHLMPKWEDIPEDFRENPRGEGAALYRPWMNWFMGGDIRPFFTPRDGINEEMAWRHLQTIKGSFEPKHEHKEATVIWLLHRWFIFNPPAAEN